jgi:hypothetical protein
LGRSTFTATDFRTPSRKGLRHRSFQRRRDHGFGFGLRKRRQAILQAFQVTRHRDADHIGPRRQELAEFQIGGSQPRQRPRQPRAGFGAGPLDQPGEAQRQLSGRRHQAWIDDAEDALAREHETGAGKPRHMS